MKKSRKYIWIIAGIVAIVIIAMVLIFQLSYHRLDQSYEEIDQIYAINYVDGKGVKVLLSEEDKNEVYAVLKHSMINVDFMVGDECGSDGPGVYIVYNDGTYETWGCRETDHTYFYRYYYWDKWGQTSVAVHSKKLLSIIEKYTKQ